MELTDDQLVDVVTRLLSVGVPPIAISKAFELDAGGIRELQGKIHVEQYGTDELSEAMTHLIWQAYDNAIHLMHEGTPANKMRMTSLVLSRPLAIAGRQTPESMEKMREFLMQLANAGGPDHDGSPGEFVLRQ